MTEVLTDVQQVTPTWLTALLQRKGISDTSTVIDIKVVESRSTNVSQVYFLSISYANPRPELPSRLFLKMPYPGQMWEDKEIEFYTILAPAMRTTSADSIWLFPHCYDVTFSPAAKCSHLLLEDLSATHFTNQHPMPPTRRLCELVIDAYAYFHAYWWEHPWLGQQIGELLTESTITGFLTSAQTKLTNFVDTVGPELEISQLTILQRVASVWPKRRMIRVIQGKGVTIVHRDPHPLNFLYPHDDQRHTVKLIDWQSWRVDTGTDDLAYLMACHWPLEEQAGLERELVERYHKQLTNQGIQDYDWDDCLYDYRASIIRCLFFLLIAWSPTQWKQGTWWERVQHGLAAYVRWNCTDLWDE